MTPPTDPAAAPAGTCCAEYAGTTRRGFLRTLAGAAGGAALTATFGDVFLQTSYAAGSAQQVLVVLSLRGAADGMSLVVPHGDPVYYTARPRIAVPSASLLAKNDMFGLHPALAPLLPLWTSGRMAAVQATGQPVANRSHFSAMEELEDAAPGSTTRVGWLNRLVGRDGTGSALQAIQMGGGVPQTALAGPQPVLTTQSADAMRLTRPTRPEAVRARRRALDKVWGPAGGTLGAGGRSALRAMNEYAPVHRQSTRPANGARYPATDLGRALQDSARTIRADVGAEIISVDHGSWDHHAGIGNLANGEMVTMARELAQAVAAFWADLGSLGTKVTLVTISEFGRRVVENANQGLDHGYGNVMLLMGSGVKGGQYYGRWPGLERRSDSDLAVTTDYRSVLNEIVRSRFNASTAKVFPGFAPERIGVMAGQ